MLLSVVGTMIRLKSEQRRALSETLRELANLVAGASVLAQLVGQAPPSLKAIGYGIAFWFALVGLSLWLAGGNTDV